MWKIICTIVSLQKHMNQKKKFLSEKKYMLYGIHIFKDIQRFCYFQYSIWLYSLSYWLWQYNSSHLEHYILNLSIKQKIKKKKNTFFNFIYKIILKSQQVSIYIIKLHSSNGEKFNPFKANLFQPFTLNSLCNGICLIYLNNNYFLK